MPDDPVGDSPRTQDGNANPCFSVVVPLYNKREYVRRTICSALAQQWDCLEVIVVDDGSTDGSGERIADLDDDRLRIVRQANAGPGIARNLGIAIARYEWIAFLDADDVWYPDHLSELARIIRACPDAALVSAAQSHVADGSVPAQPTERGTLKQIDYFAYAGIAPFGTSATAARRDVFESTGNFGDFRPGQDTEMWARIMLDHQSAISTRVTSVYAKETGGISDSAARRRRAKNGPARSEPSPLNRLLTRALEDRRFADKHGAIRKYLDDRAMGGVRKALVEGDVVRARRMLATVGTRDCRQFQVYRLLVAVPTVTRAVLAMRSLVRQRIARG